MASVLIYNKKIKSWHNRYGLKPLSHLSKETINWYKWCSKIGRKEYLKKSREKTQKFEQKHIGNRAFRVFKCMILKNKNVNIKLESKFKKLIENKASVKAGYANSHLNPNQLYKKMLGAKK